MRSRPVSYIKGIASQDVCLSFILDLPEKYDEDEIIDDDVFEELTDAFISSCLEGNIEDYEYKRSEVSLVDDESKISALYKTKFVYTWELDVEVFGRDIEVDPGCFYLSNGDPGYPAEYERYIDSGYVTAVDMDMLKKKLKEISFGKYLDMNSVNVNIADVDEHDELRHEEVYDSGYEDDYYD